MADSGRQIGDCRHARRPEFCVECLRAERDKLQKFKDWVHAYLDGKDVPHHPPGTHGAEGCRIGDRMDWVWAERDRLREVLHDLYNEQNGPPLPTPRHEQAWEDAMSRAELELSDRFATEALGCGCTVFKGQRCYMHDAP